MRLHYFRKFLIRLGPLGLLLWTGAVCLIGAQTLQAKPAIQNSPPAGENSSPGGGDVIAGDDALPTSFLLEEARNAAERHDFVIAEALYQTVLLRERQNLPAILELAAVYEKTGKLEYARGLLLRASVLRPHDEKIIAMNKDISELLSNVLVEEVDSLIAHRQCELALPKLSLLLTIEPENPDFHYKKALCHLEVGKPKTALIYIEDALRLQKNVEYFNLHADITKRIEQDEIDELVANARSYIRNDTPPNRERAMQIIGDILRIDPEHEWARQSFEVLSRGEIPSKELIHAEGTEAGAFAETNERSAGSGSGIGGIAGVLRNRHALLLLAVSITAFILAIFAFAKFRSKPPVYPLSGRFSHFSLRDILGLIDSTSRTGVLHIHSKFTGGEVYFQNGKVCHCKTGKLTGPEAFSLLIAKVRPGSVQFLDCAPPLKPTIDASAAPPDVEPEPEAPAADSGGTAPVTSRRPKSRMKELLDSKR
jgi:tetratricopeptide (TPR) repeat protein